MTDIQRRALDEALPVGKWRNRADVCEECGVQPNDLLSELNIVQRDNGGTVEVSKILDVPIAKHRYRKISKSDQP